MRSEAMRQSSVWPPPRGLLTSLPCSLAFNPMKASPAWLESSSRLTPRNMRSWQKNDYNDAEAIAEAALRPNLRFVQEKSQDQLDLQACHRVRSRLVSRRTATINQIRAFLIEQGIALRTRAGEAFERGRDFRGVAWSRATPVQNRWPIY